MSDVVHQHFRPAEQAIVKRLEEFSSGVERTGVSRRTDFLSPREAWIAQIICAKYSLAVSLYGGYEHAERQRAIISDVHEHPGEENFEVVAVRVDVPKGSSTLRHGDFLGALLGVGIRRDGLGDIAFLPDHTAYVFCTKQMVNILLRDFTQVGKTSVTIRVDEQPPISQFLASTLMEQKVTLQSLRLDAFLAHAFGMSRSKAVEPIRSGKVQLNHVLCVEPSQEIVEHDVVSLRGSGRARVMGIEGNSRSGRIFVRIGRYV
ncbi:MAG: YlmH/Sll1252 family protein [Acidibacillus sp.]|uniref:RNA-binding S4 domain-containing protein n=1 Tax=Sulfoacidibacillus ferrooxidans TaxID=2005001 RepID=A0A9X1VAC7_9BACL|nr:YlmH/Sll1252 family protein [Sulfoacidibacillus ferrooxidans]MCI0184199.1 hypothetical protein [Sulfoacidibacillus ferrooxidans]MCY0892946.1 YlmH/Sll1252 family protein [Acidibacillus sp.]